jgi:PKD repeat protein
VIDTGTDSVTATVPVGSAPLGVAVAPDEAPTASFTTGAGVSDSPTSFDASASSAPVGTVAAYAWNFGDGATATTSDPTITHTYASAGTYPVSLTVTDSAGTSSTQVFTGQTVSRNGGPSATAASSIVIAAPTVASSTTGPSPGSPSTAGPLLASTPDGNGYWIAAPDGGVFSYGDAVFHGSLVGTVHLVAPISGIASTPDGEGYWLVGADGGVFAEGDAPYLGSTGGMHLNAPVVGIIGTPSGHGYWLVSKDGGVFAFGDASFYGSMGATVLNAPIVAMAASPSGHGYWLVGADGGIFAFGDARYEGSLANLILAQPVLGMATTPSGAGYWLLAKDGGVFAEGDAHFFGSLGDAPATLPGGSDSVVGLLAQADATGYTIVDSDGTANAFGS